MLSSAPVQEEYFVDGIVENKKLFSRKNRPHDI
jgi:hypothetical protein